MTMIKRLKQLGALLAVWVLGIGLALAGTTLVGQAIGAGDRDWAERLAAHSDPGYAEQGQLTVTYLTPAHQACQRQLQRWMHDCGFDDVRIDAVGNVVGSNIFNVLFILGIVLFVITGASLNVDGARRVPDAHQA